MRSSTLFIAIIMTTDAFVVLPHNMGKLSERRLVEDEMILGEDVVSSLSDQQGMLASLKARQSGNRERNWQALPRPHPKGLLECPFIV
jgi:hypothetical protein